MLFFGFETLVELDELIEGGGGASQVGGDGLGGAVLDRDEFGERSGGFGEGDGFGGGDGAGDRFHLWEGGREGFGVPRVSFLFRCLLGFWKVV